MIYPLRIYKRESTVTLSLISDDTKQHYCLIKDISKLLSLQTSKHGHVRHVCFKYLNTLNSENSLASHHEYCKSYEVIKIEVSEEGSKISFKNHIRSMRVPFIVYADFESFAPQLSICQPNPEKSYTKQYQKHITSEFCYHSILTIQFILSTTSVFVKEFSDDDVAQIFMDTLEKNINEICNKFKFKMI